MDFEDGGIETEPKINTDEQEKSLKQPVEPIISFSPERCRFSDSSAQSSSRKGSSTSFPISVADLQLDQPNNGVSPKSTTSTTSIITPAPHKPSHSHPQPIILDEHPSSTSISTQPSSLFTTASSNPLKPAAFPLFNPSALTTSSSSSSASTSLHHQAPPPPSLGVISANTSSSSSQAHRSPSLTDPISLMVNGTVLSANPTSTPTSTSSSSATSSTTALDLQKRLEKRIAQASAIAAAQAAQVQVSSSSSTSPKQTTLPASSSAATTSSSETKASTTDSILLTDIIGIANKPGGVATTGKNNGNQISFSPPEEKVVSSLDPLWTPEHPSAAAETEIDDFWESSNKVLASSNQNKLEDGFPLESPAAGESAESGDCFDLTSSVTTSCKNGESTTVADGVNSKSSRNKAKGNQSLRNNNRSTSPPSSSSSSSPPTSNVPASSSVSAPPFSSCDKTPSVITVVNASFDIRKVSALLPPQRMAIPSKSSSSNSQSSHHSQLSSAREAKSAKSSGSKNNNNNGALSNNSVTFSAFSNTSNKNSNDTSNPPPPCSSSALSSSSSSGVSSAQKTSSRLASISETQINSSSGNGNIKTGNLSKLSNDSEKKPLVQWDSDESEEELSFFPSTKRGVITDNLSIDNMSLSGEEDDLHLTPPRPLAKKCPCDPRTWLEKADISAGHSHHHHGDPTRVISSKFSCVIC